MGETLIILRDPQIGDALMSLPALHYLAWELARERVIYVAFANQEVARIAEMPVNVRDLMANFEPPFGLSTPGGPTPYADAEVIVLGVAAAIGYEFGEKVLHPTQAVMAWAGLDISADVPQPKINVPDIDVPECDFLIAPWSKDRSRSLTPDEVNGLIDTLLARDGAARIAVLGGIVDPVVTSSTYRGMCVYGKPLDYVVNLMRRCKRAVITVDSAMNRLAHAAGISNHVLLGANVTPPQWQTHPGCHLYYGPPHEWRTEEILRLVEECA